MNAENEETQLPMKISAREATIRSICGKSGSPCVTLTERSDKELSISDISGYLSVRTYTWVIPVSSTACLKSLKAENKDPHNHKYIAN